MTSDENESFAAVKTPEYVVVARRYRPQGFGELVGQGVVAQALKNAIKTDRVGHAYLFTGARGVGKTSTARIFAKALNCKQGPTPDPCDACDICVQITGGEDVDVLEIDGASNRGIDEIRQLRSNVGIRPSRAKFKVYIIDEVHMLTKEAFNALLKTLEEPPEHVKFIFCTTEPGKIPITVLSRCQRFDFSPVDAKDIAGRLQHIVNSEGATADPEALDLLARKAAGSMRDSQSLLEQLLSFVGNNISVDDVHSMFGTAKADRIYAIVDQLVDRNAAGALRELQFTLTQGVDAGQLSEQLITSFRDILASSVGCDPNLLLFHSPNESERLSVCGQRWGTETLLASIQILDECIQRMRQSVYGRILLETALVRIAHLEDLDELSQAIAAVSAGGLTGVSIETKKKQTPERTRTDVDTKTLTSPPSAPAVEAESPTQDSVRDSTTDRPTTNGEVEHADSETPTAANIPSPANASTDDAADHAANEATGELKKDQGKGESKSDTADEEVKPPELLRNVEFSAENVKKIWSAALEELSDMASDFAGQASEVAISAPNVLAVRFLSRYNTSKTYCERPERREKLEKVVSEIVGKKIHLDFSILRNDDAHEPIPQPTVKNNQQLKREITSHPMVEAAVEIFDAQVSKIDPGNRSD